MSDIDISHHIAEAGPIPPKLLEYLIETLAESIETRRNSLKAN